MYASAIAVPSQLIYLKIPHRDLYNFVDGIFPSLDKFPIADAVKGGGHRYKYGHDLFIDVPRTFFTHGPMDSMRHIGHIVLTDFPTKAGIPIPGFSQSGLGSLLEQAGINRGWMNMSLFDGGIGILCVSEGATDLAQALAGTLGLSWETFFNTYVEGTIEVLLSVSLQVQNPILFAAGVENILAGVVSTWKELSVYIDPLKFFGSAGISALIGFTVAYGLLGENLSNAAKDAIRSGVIGAMYTVSQSFGFGMIAGFSAFRIGTIIANKHSDATSSSLSINREAYALLVDELCKGNMPVRSLLESATPRIRLRSEVNILPVSSNVIEDKARILSNQCNVLRDEQSTLKSNAPSMNKNIVGLLIDPPILVDLYRMALNK